MIDNMNVDDDNPQPLAESGEMSDIAWRTLQKFTQEKNDKTLKVYYKGLQIFGEIMKRYREKTFMTRTDLALKCGLNRDVIFSIENGILPIEDIRNVLSNLSIVFSGDVEMILNEAMTHHLDGSRVNELIPPEGLGAKKMNEGERDDNISLLSSIQKSSKFGKSM